MRHARLTPTLPIGLLAMAVILLACCGGLIATARCPLLLLPHSLPAAVAAIALASITTRADSEERVARGVKASPHAKALHRPICCRSTAHSQHNTPGDDRTDDWRLRRDDVACRRPKFRKLRFQMIADILVKAYTITSAALRGIMSILLACNSLIPVKP